MQHVEGPPGLDSTTGTDSAEASAASFGSVLTSAGSPASAQRLSDSVSSHLGRWRGFKVRVWLRRCCRVGSEHHVSKP